MNNNLKRKCLAKTSKNLIYVVGGIKTLMYFEGCANSHLGASILLRGSSESELKKVKNVTLMMIFAAYSARLEKSFLMDEFAEPLTLKGASFFDDSSRNNSPSKDDKCIVNEEGQKSDNRLKNFQILSPETNETMDLFKSAAKSTLPDTQLDDSKESDSSNPADTTLELFTNSANNAIIPDPQRTENSEEKVLADEKRACGKYVSDKSDPLHQYLYEDEDSDTVIQTSPSGQYLSVAEIPLLNKFKTALEDTILSISPFLKFSVPYLETESGRNCVLRAFFPKDLYYSAYFLDKVEGA